jgi:hypothetical protein
MLLLRRCRHFVVAPGHCHDLETSASLTRSIESAFLDWRREELLKIDLAQVARRIVQESIRACPGDKILVIYGSHGLDLAELILVELQALRCRSHSRLWSYGSSRTLTGTATSPWPTSISSLGVDEG